MLFKRMLDFTRINDEAANLMNDIYAIMKNRRLIYFEETTEAQQTS